MRNVLLLVIPVIFFSFPLIAREPVLSTESGSYLLREWDNNKNKEYLELKGNYRRGELRTYRIKTVYGELQEKEKNGGYNISVGIYIMNCFENVFRLNKTYFFRGEELTNFSHFDDQYYRDDPNLGWKTVDTDKSQTKVYDIICK